MTTYAPQPARPSGTRPRRLWLIIAAIVVATLVGGASGWLIGSASSGSANSASTPTAPAPAGGLGAPHGPKVIRNGVPSGYTHDQAGAANAAVNAVQVQTAVAHGNADGAETASTWIAASADAHARAALSAATGAPGDDQTSKTPVTTRVTSFAGSATTVEVWIVAVGSSAGIGGGVTTSQTWSTQTYTLNWEKDDWKVVSFRTKNGPQPGDGQSSTGSSVPPLTNGLYTVFIN
ncbi:hypothetical protein ACIA5G_39895 [Amycolatopsis sp. NPDC051758]|uniref:hypothetical protein n=1 Tax=Amycolatopsis sp. NPDC051758 TaxID=3363935 RepID=UPI0037B2EA42